MTHLALPTAWADHRGRLPAMVGPGYVGVASRSGLKYSAGEGLFQLIS